MFAVVSLMANASGVAAGFRHPGTYPKKPVGFFWVHPPKKTHPPKPYFYFNLILVYTLCATNNAIFYCFYSF